MSQVPAKKSITQNALFNFLSQLIPLLTAVICMPYLVRFMGTDRVGLLLLVWAVVGYFSIMDLGLGKAVMKTTAEAITLEEYSRVPTLFWSAIISQAVVGVVGGVIIAMTPLALIRFVNVPSYLQKELTQTMYIIAVSFPAMLMASPLISFLQGLQRFDLTARVLTPIGICQYLIPLLCSVWLPSLPFVVSSLLIIRFISYILLFKMSTHAVPKLMKSFGFNRREFLSLLRFGGWVTGSSVAITLLNYIDRFVIGCLLPVSAVAYYSVPADAVVRLLIFPGSIVMAAFPAFSSLAIRNDLDRINSIVIRSAKYVLYLLGLPVACAIVFAPDLMRLWMGEEFAAHSSLILQVLLSGIILASLSYIPYHLLQSIGRADLTAKVHSVEFFLQGGLSYALVSKYGIQGAGFSYALRVACDMITFFWLARNYGGIVVSRRQLGRIFWLLAFLVLICVAGIVIHPILNSIQEKAFVLMLMALGGEFLVWKVFMDPVDRGAILHVFSSVLRRRTIHNT